MNEVRRARIQCDIEQLAAARERIHKIRDDEDLMSEVGFLLMIAIDRLSKAKK